MGKILKLKDLIEIGVKAHLTSGMVREGEYFALTNDLSEKVRQWAISQLPENMEFPIPTIGYFGEKPECIKIAEAKNIGVKSCIDQARKNIEDNL